MSTALALREQIGRVHPKSKASAIRLLLNEIEAVLNSECASQADVRAALQSAGYSFTASEFRNALHRARAARKKATPHAKSPPAAPPARTAAPTTPAGRFDWQQHRDKNPDW